MSKYGNQKLELYGISFDSKLELFTYQVFKDAGYDIKRCEDSFELFPRFTYIDSLTNKKRSVTAMKYTSDFYIQRSPKTLVIECKGFKTEPYRMRKKLFLYHYGKKYDFIEITSQKQCLEVLEKLR